MLGIPSRKVIITGEEAKKLTRYVNGQLTDEEKKQKEEAEKRFKEAKKKYKVIWKTE